MLSDVERLAIDSDDYSEVMFSLHRYYIAAEYCKGKVVTDIACGTGYGSFIMSKNAKKLIGLDIDSITIENAKKKFSGANLEFKLTPPNKFLIPSNTQDVVVSYETIEHLNYKDQAMFLSETKRVLKKSGILLISTPNLDRTSLSESVNPFHIGELTPQKFKNSLLKFYKHVDLYFLELNAVSIMKKIGENSNFELIETDKNLVTKKSFDKPIYMLAACSNSSLDGINLSSIHSDINRTLMMDLWRKIGNKDYEIKKLNEEKNELKRALNRFLENKVYKIYRFLKKKVR